MSSPTPSTKDTEKSPTEQKEVEIYASEIDTSDIDEKILLRKLDWTLLPWVLSLLYLLSFLDRASIGNARLYHLEKSLHMHGNQYNIALTIFFFSYAAFEVPSNVLLKRLRPSMWLSTLMLLWGVIMMAQGLVTNYGGLLSMRFLLGVFEAGLFPGVSYYLSCWYKRSEYGIRLALFFSAATVAGAFGGLLAAAISKMEGVGGKPAWAWIFIIEGLATVVAGAVSFFIVQDFPENAKFLSETERAFVIRRLQDDLQFSAAGEKLKKKYITDSLRDWKTWIGMLVYAGIVEPLYTFALFLPTIISQLGFKATPANLLTVPPYVFACVVTCGMCYLSDRQGRRGIFNLVFFLIAGTGYVILMISRNFGLSYFAVFLAAGGLYPLIPLTAAWFSNNFEGSYKRGVSLAMIISFGNLNGSVSSNVYRTKDKPRFLLGHGIVLLYICLGFITSVITLVLLRRENAARDRGERDEYILAAGEEKGSKTAPGGVYESVEAARMDKGDLWSGYRYML